MRILLAGIVVLAVSALPPTAFAKTRPDGADTESTEKSATPELAPMPRVSVSPPTSPEIEHQQLRELLASQSEELRAMREQLRQLQQRMYSSKTSYIRQLARPMRNKLPLDHCPRNDP